MKKKKNGKAAASAVAAVTAAGVIIGGSFSSPADIMDGGDAIVQSYDGGSRYDDDDGSVSEDDEDEGKRGSSSAVRRFLMQAPHGVRAFIVVPLWLIGTGITAALSFLFSALLSPLASKLISWLAVAVLAYLMYILSAKLLSPDTPLKKLFNRRSLLLVPLVCAGFALLDCLLPVVWDDYEKLAAIIKCCVFTLCASIPTLLLLKRKHRAAAEVPDEAPSEAEQLAESRKLVMELADTVCPKR